MFYYFFVNPIFRNKNGEVKLILWNSEFQGIFPPKKNPGYATAVWIKIILNITKLIDYIFKKRINTFLKGTSRNLYQIFNFRLSEVHQLLVLFSTQPSLLDWQISRGGESIFFLFLIVPQCCILFTKSQLVLHGIYQLANFRRNKHLEIFFYLFSLF